MRILSKFKDYYDSISNIGGHDNTIIYHRVREEHKEKYKGKTIRCPFYPPFGKAEKSRDKNEPDDSIFVIFCGELFFCVPYWGKTEYDKVMSKKIEIEPKDLKWNDFEKWDKLFSNKGEGNDQLRLNHSLWGKAKYADFKEEFKKDYTKMNLKYNSPIILFHRSFNFWGDSKLIINPRLQDYQFARAIDPYTAFQKLENFVDTHFTRNVDMAEISQEDRYAMKGFDKWSFRKEPWKKKKKNG